MKTFNLPEAADFLHMHQEEVRTRAKRGLIPGAKIGRRWVFIEDDLAEFVRSLYPVKRQALPVTKTNLEGADRSGGSLSRTIKEYEKLLGLNSTRRRTSQ
jgi:hypothetical protein